MEQEQLSALMDGELEPDHADRLLRGMRDDPEAVAMWTQYHFIGDVLRGEPSLAPAMSARLAAALAAEPTILAPRRAERATNTRRISLQIAASVAGVAVVGWLAFSSVNDRPKPDEVIALASARDDAVRDLTRMHLEFSPNTAMPGVASYIRTVGINERDRVR